MDLALADHGGRQLQHNGRDIAVFEKVLPILERRGNELVALVERALEPVQRDAVTSKQVWRQSDERPNSSRAFDDFPRVPTGDGFPRGALNRVLACRSTDLVALHMDVLVHGRVAQLAEAELECDLFDIISIEIEPKRVEPFFPERLRGG